VTGRLSDLVLVMYANPPTETVVRLSRGIVVTKVFDIIMGLDVPILRVFPIQDLQTPCFDEYVKFLKIY
jgi:hypothetical protein